MVPKTYLHHNIQKISRRPAQELTELASGEKKNKKGFEIIKLTFDTNLLRHPHNNINNNIMTIATAI